MNSKDDGFFVGFGECNKVFNDVVCVVCVQVVGRFIQEEDGG